MGDRSSAGGGFDADRQVEFVWVEQLAAADVGCEIVEVAFDVAVVGQEGLGIAVADLTATDRGAELATNLHQVVRPEGLEVQAVVGDGAPPEQADQEPAVSHQVAHDPEVDLFLEGFDRFARLGGQEEEELRGKGDVEVAAANGLAGPAVDFGEVFAVFRAPAGIAVEAGQGDLVVGRQDARHALGPENLARRQFAPDHVEEGLDESVGLLQRVHGWSDHFDLAFGKVGRDVGVVGFAAEGGGMGRLGQTPGGVHPQSLGLQAERPHPKQLLQARVEADGVGKAIMHGPMSTKGKITVEPLLTYLGAIRSYRADLKDARRWGAGAIRFRPPVGRAEKRPALIISF